MTGEDEAAAGRGTADSLEHLSARVAKLESVLKLVDLLGLPGILLGGAEKIFAVSQSADSLGAQAEGFSPPEKTSAGRTVRWTQFPRPGVLRIPIIANFPWRISLRALVMPHIRAPQDIELSLDGQLLQATDTAPAPENEIEFRYRFASGTTGLLTLSLNAREAMSVEHGVDRRLLGVPFTGLTSSPGFLENGNPFDL